MLQSVSMTSYYCTIVICISISSNNSSNTSIVLRSIHSLFYSILLLHRLIHIDTSTCRLPVRITVSDLIETYKFINNKYKTDPRSLFSLPYRKLRGHKDKVFKPSARTDIQKQFLPRDATQSAVMPQYVVRPSVCLSVRNA